VNSALTGVVLAGGSNRRFPVLKGLMKVQGERIVERNIRLLKGFFRDVLISTNYPEKYFYTGEMMIGDLYPSIGPMVGIFSALLNAEVDGIFVVACDMPFVKRGLVEYLLEMESDKPVVLCSFNNRIHPLLGIYKKDAISYIEDSIRGGVTEMMKLIDDINVEVVSDEDIKSIDSDGRSFVNINTPEDYEKFIGGSICLD